MSSFAYAALWFFVFSVPWQNVIVIQGLGAVSRLTGMVAMGMALLAALVSGRVRRWHLFHVAALLFVIWAGTGVLVFEMQNIPKKFWTYLQLLLMLWMIWELAPSRKRQLGILAAYVFGAYVSAISTIIVFRRDVGGSRFAAEGFDSNDIAAILALALPMAWYLGTVHRQPLLRLIFRAYFPVAIVAIGLTGSRGGMLATMVALLIVPLSMTRLSPGRLVTTIAILGITGAVAVAYVPEKVVQRLATTRTEVQQGGVGGRLKLWVAAAQAFARRPVLGYGTSGFKPAIEPYLVAAPQAAHNSYLSVLVEQGILGFLLYALMFVTVFRAVLRLPTLERRFALVLLGTLLMVMLPLTWEDQKPVWFILAALLGLARAPALASPGLGRQAQPPRAAPLAGGLKPQRRPQRLPSRRWNADPDARA